MKKTLSLLLAVCLLMTAFSVNAFAADSSQEANANLTKEYTAIFLGQLNRGDIDGDNKVTVEEASKILRIAAKLDEPQAGVNYDITGDGRVTTEDARRALRISSGLEMGATNEEIFEYFKNELNTVKKSFPGFDKKTTAKTTDARISVTGAPSLLLYPDINANNEEIVSYYKRTEKTWKLVASNEEYNNMLDSAQEVYTPVETSKTVPAGSNTHYTQFPIMSKTYTCKLDYEDIKGIKIVEKNGDFVITLTMNSYTYDEKNPYPATSYDSTERENLPYGKIFNLPTFNSGGNYNLEKIVFDKGTVVLTVNAETGVIKDVNYSYTYTTTIKMNTDGEDTDGIEMRMKNVSSYNENYVMLTQ